jgi:phosphoribosylformylglycinamidine synthase
MSRVAVVQFPGSCDEPDAERAVAAAGHEAVPWFHKDGPPDDVAAVVLPGGFSYGDYLRTGFLASHSPAMAWIRSFAEDGGTVLGVCNGFQVLCEAGLLPGALLPNAGRRFVCRQQDLVVEDAATAATRGLAVGDRLSVPVKHFAGRYVRAGAADARVVLRYAGSNPNGSEDAIAAVANPAGNVVGLMPHPEHAIDPLTGSADGLAVFRAIAAATVAA